MQAETALWVTALWVTALWVTLFKIKKKIVTQRYSTLEFLIAVMLGPIYNIHTVAPNFAKPLWYSFCQA